MAAEDIFKDACAFDRDCGPGLLCYRNVTWLAESATQGLCVCNQFYGWRGADCSGRSGTTFYLCIVLVLQGLLALALFWRGALDLWRLVRSKAAKLNALLITHVSVTLGLVFHALWRLMLLLTTLIPEESNAFLSDEDDAEKFTTFSIIMRPFVFLTLVFTVVACLNVSVMWVELAYRAKNMRTKLISNVTYYRRTVLVFEVLFGAAMLAIAILGMWSAAAVIALPFLFVIGVSFTVGRVRMVSVLKGAMSMAMSSSTNEGGVSGSAASGSVLAPPLTPSSAGKSTMNLFKRSGGRSTEKSTLERTRRTMEVIQRVSLHVIAGIIGVIVVGIPFFLFNSVLHPSGSREYTVYGSFSWLTWLNDMLAVFILYILTAILFYSHRSVVKSLRRAAHPQAVSSVPSKDGSYTNTRGATDRSFMRPEAASSYESGFDPLAPRFSPQPLPIVPAAPPLPHIVDEPPPPYPRI